ncbi:MAG TPA: tRNA 2-selenouridine(34) synthase MnmH [Bacteroidales bacterium]|nr:tRNA 2-selenouridine(34) synthase MnmH [Bacteroidales bacterium]
MKEPVPIEVFLNLSKDTPFADVRSPAEFRQGHIPGAINIPLFTDEERKVIGTLYKKKGRKEAIIKGFEYTGIKASDLAREARESAPGGRLLVHCWRGGMRSGAMAWLFEQSGLQCEVLNGGYKSFRRFVRSTFDKPLKLIVLGGMTGTGKTEILKEISQQSWQIIDLEGLANHKGSAFGSLGEQAQPTNEQYENELLMKVRELDVRLPVFTEDESRNIGRNIIPPELYTQMRNSPAIFLDMERSLRVDRLVKDYGKYPPEDLISCINRVSKRIGGQNASQAIKCVEKGDFHKVAEITLHYYDKTYLFGLNKRQPGNVHRVMTHTLSARANAALVLDYCKSARLI